MPGAFRANYLDGKSAARRPASIRMAQTGLEVSLEDGGRLWWPLREIRQTQGSYAGEQIRLERGQPFPEVLVIDDPAFLTALHETAPTFGRRFHDPRKRRRRILLTIVAALVSIVAGGSLYMWGIPTAAGVLAARVPVSWEEKLGNAAMEEIGRSERRCVDADREAAIMAIVNRLLEPMPNVPYKFRLTVFNDSTVNAFALPGGQIVLLRGLIERSKTPEELAGVLAHELQHVLKRHATRLLLQHASTGLMLVAVSGDLTGVMAYGLESARVLGTLSYSRGLESEAVGMEPLGEGQVGAPDALPVHLHRHLEGAKGIRLTDLVQLRLQLLGHLTPARPRHPIPTTRLHRGPDRVHPGCLDVQLPLTAFPLVGRGACCCGAGCGAGACSVGRACCVFSLARWSRLRSWLGS